VTRHRVAAAVVAASIGACSGALADTVVSASLEEVTVTARKVAETRFDVPLSIDVIPADALLSGLPLDLSRLALLSPGLYFESLWGGLGAAPVLRGQSQPSTAGDNVGVFVDGVYQAERTAIDSVPIDIEQVEVVRGPQSTLFGQSTFAGAIHYVPRLPTRTLAAGAEALVGTDEYVAANAYLSGPLKEGIALGRLAVGFRDSHGTQANSASDASLGDLERAAIAGTLASDREGPWSAHLSGRWTSASLGHPAVSIVNGADYNCGAVDPATNMWSYYCGPLPRDARYDISTGIPDSQLDVNQAALAVSWRGDRLEFGSDTAYYRGSTETFRDFDASADGETFGVCVLPACPLGASPPRPVDRLTDVNSVSRLRNVTSEWTQEFRLQGTPSTALSWMIGWTGILTQRSNRSGFGFARDDLAANEALTILLPLAPGLAGPVARANLSLVDDPNRQQLMQPRIQFEQRTFAFFGSIDYRMTEHWSVRAEGRATRQYLELAGNAIPSQGFTDTTPRLSLQYLRAGNSMLYVSAAKGSRAGGINSTVGLASDEQTFDPEFNWTYELGGRIERSRWSADATLYYIDWQDTQLPGFPLTPGINTLITRNTAGVTTEGVELAFRALLHERVALRAAYSHSASEFYEGSDDPGSSAFCGLKGANIVSSFCSVGPARSGNAPIGTYVPYIDGNALPRAPVDQWSLTLQGDLTPAAVDWRLTSSLDVGYQDDVYDRAINGGQFGERTLVSARVSWSRGPWVLEAWGSNLTDEQYVRGVSSRGAPFYPVSPRPLDLVYGDGRRLGLTLRYAR
jgi:iron complex outermembrane recepter protein